MSRVSTSLLISCQRTDSSCYAGTFISTTINSVMTAQTDSTKSVPSLKCFVSSLLIPSTHKHSVDEVMVAKKGTRAGTLRQYIANKPDKWALNYSVEPFHLASSTTFCFIKGHPRSSMLPSVKTNRGYSGSEGGENAMQNHKRAPFVCCIL